MTYKSFKLQLQLKLAALLVYNNLLVFINNLIAIIIKYCNTF